jgi:hypothetical protein
MTKSDLQARPIHVAGSSIVRSSAVSTRQAE